jgi:hypothetical protein
MGIKIQSHGRIIDATVTTSAAPATQGIEGHGTARCSKTDVYLAEIGETIAVGRAYQDLGRKIVAIGNAQCVTKAEYKRVSHLIMLRDATASPRNW